MDNETAPIPPVPDQPSEAPVAAPRRSRILVQKGGLPLLVGAGGVIAGAVLAFGVRAAADDDSTVDANLTAQSGQVPQMQGQTGQQGQLQQGQTGQAPGGIGGPGGETALTGDVADKVTEAVQAEYPDAQILRLEQESEGVYEAHIVDDGQMLRLLLDEDYAITQTDEGMGGPGMGGPMGQAPDATTT